VITQFFGHIVRGEPSSSWTAQAERAFTYIDDGIDALMKIIENRKGSRAEKSTISATRRTIYSVRDLAGMM